jgi:predicted PurR-regulated permease PerM
MPAPKPRIAATDALVGLWTVALTAFVIAALYFGRDLLIPLALAALLTFLLSPLVTRLERWLGRIVAVLLVVALIFSALGGAGYILTRQLVDLATKLPEYKGNIVEKLHAFRTPKGGTFTKLSQTVDELKQELPGGSAPDTPVITKEPGKPETAIASPPNPLPNTVPVKVVETSRGNPFELVQTIITPLLGPLGVAALVLVLVVCMLFQREDLRNRLIRLVGQGRIGATTRALDDASDRVSRYLRMQLLVNITYGVCIGIGLYFIGVPNAALWGALSIVLRFIPYIGPWVATVLPTLLALAISPGWTMPLLTVALFGGIELILNNVLEPLLYGKHTGVSSIALIVAAVFWTWLWGPLGLVLATPLTVCLVVMGRHIPRLSFLGVLLSDEEPLTPAQDCYHRLLTAGEQDETELVDDYLKENSLVALYDSVLVPVISSAETDARDGRLDPEQLADVRESLRVILDDLAMRPAASDQIKEEQIEIAHRPNTAPDPACRVYCIPARAERDEFAGAMLTQLLREQSFEVHNAAATIPAAELLERLATDRSDVACISVVAPSTVIHARFLCTKLRARFPTLKIIVGLWGATERVAEATKRLHDSGASETVTSLAAAMEEITALSATREPLVSVTAA